MANVAETSQRVGQILLGGIWCRVQAPPVSPIPNWVAAFDNGYASEGNFTAALPVGLLLVAVGKEARQTAAAAATAAAGRCPRSPRPGSPWPTAWPSRTTPRSANSARPPSSRLFAPTVRPVRPQPQLPRPGRRRDRVAPVGRHPQHAQDHQSPAREPPQRRPQRPPARLTRRRNKPKPPPRPGQRAITACPPPIPVATSGEQGHAEQQRRADIDDAAQRDQAQEGRRNQNGQGTSQPLRATLISRGWVR